MRNKTFWSVLLGLMWFGVFQQVVAERPRAVRSWVVLGNSLAWHHIDSFWWGEWGMAASCPQKDWVHRVQRKLTRRYHAAPQLKLDRIVWWETGYDDFDFSRYDSLFTGREDLVVLRAGENAGPLDSEEKRQVYARGFGQLLDYLCARAPQAQIVVTGLFWKDEVKDSIQRVLTQRHGLQWAPLSQLDVPKYHATLDTRVQGADGAWHFIREGGEIAEAVAAHPNDRCMKAIAKVVYRAAMGREIRPKAPKR